jgi:hypothetical protein
MSVDPFTPAVRGYRRVLELGARFEYVEGLALGVLGL